MMIIFVLFVTILAATTFEPSLGLMSIVPVTLKDFTAALAQEKKVTGMIHRMYDLARDLSSSTAVRFINSKNINYLLNINGGIHILKRMNITEDDPIKGLKYAAIEVPSAMNLEQCWDLINLSEKTRMHCFILENCCYDDYEMKSLLMAQDGVFGEVIRAEGAYIHELSEFWKYYWKDPNDNDVDNLHWRMKYNMENRGDVYATHGLGPVAQCMDIHRGDRFTTLIAMDTESFAGKDWVKKNTGKEPKSFLNGDHTTTLMRTAKGKVVEIQHNVMTPQPYNRLFKLTGTKGYATKYPTEEFAIAGDALKGTDAPKMDNINAHGFLNKEQKKALMEKYRHPILDKYAEKGRHLGHGGMDYVMDSRLVYCLQHGLPLDMDVYDMAEWCALAELGALSMDNNCAAVTFPDFTRGHWNEVKGYTHAYATPEQEAAQEAYADAYTAAQKEAAAKLNLWTLYDAAKNAEGKAKAAAEKKYNKAAAKLDAQIEKILKAKK